MKKSLLIFISIILTNCCLAAPVKKVLLTLKPNESIFWGEYLGNTKISGFNFSCILQNTKDNTYTLIWNGQRMQTSKYIDIAHIDVNDFSKCIYSYFKDDGIYLQLESELYGPYENIWCYDWLPMMFDDDDGVNTQYFKRRRFEFKQMGTIYTHDFDGMIFNSKEGRSEFTSPNGLHHAQLEESRRVLRIDNVPYVLPKPIDIAKEDVPDVCLFDDGTCYYQQRFGDELWGPENFHCYYITPTEIIEIDHYKEYFNLDTHTIELKNMLPGYQIPFNVDGGFDDNGNVVIEYEFTVQDKSRKHLLNAKWDYNYVLIDGKKYGNTCPIHAFYDEAENAFAWIVVENNQIVLYTLSL